MLKKIVEINAANNLSTGTIMLHIAETARESGMEVYTFSKMTRTAKKKNIDNHYLVGTVLENTLHRYFSWITDFQECGSYFGTKKLIKQIDKIKPDIIHMHDLVGWYINIDVLFKYLKEKCIPVVWTFHCCWAYTGRCIYYDYVGCSEWKNGCKKCIQPEGYPTTWFFDHAAWNYKRKKRLFTELDNLTIVTPSKWLQGEVKESFLNKYECIVINNGIDTDVFRPRKNNFRERWNLKHKKIVLGVSSAWGQERKGLKYMLQLSEILDDTYKVVIVGLSNEEKEKIPIQVLGIGRTSNAIELAEIYSEADVFVNPTLEDNFPTTNIEALACGTPVITFDTGGSVEAIDENTGKIVQQKDLEGLKSAIEEICAEKDRYFNACVEKGKKYCKSIKFSQYIELYNKIIEGK